MSKYIDRCIELSERDHEELNVVTPWETKLTSIYNDPSEKGQLKSFPDTLWKPRVIQGEVLGRVIYFATDIIRDIPGMKRVSIVKDPSWFNETMPELKQKLRSSIGLLRTEILDFNETTITVRYGVFGLNDRKKWGPYVDYTLVRGDETQTPDMPALEWAGLWAV